MKIKLFDHVRCLARGVCISAMFLLAIIPSVHSSSPAAAVEVITTGLNDISGLRLNDNDLYFVTDYHSSNCALKKVAKAGGSVSTIIDGVALYDSGSYRGIEDSYAVNSDIFGGYGGYVSYKIFKAPKVGGAVTNLASISGGGFIGVAGNYLYYSSGLSSINRMPDDGTGSTTLLSGYWVRSSGIDSKAIYFVDYGSKDVKKFDINTSTLSTLIGENSDEGGVAIDSNNVYFFLNGTVKKVSKSGGSVTTLISNIAGGGISDDTYLYFVQDNAIKKIPVSGGTISTVTTEYTGSISGMAVDDTYLYWGDTSGGNGSGKIVRTPKSSSSTFVIQPGPEGTDTCYGTVYATKGTPDAASLYIGGWGDFYYDFFWFDLTGSPSAAETVSAKLYLYGSAPNNPGFKLNRITESWTEGGVTLANNPASVFYKKFGSFAVGADGWNSIDITKLYKNWKKGRFPNYGVKLVPTRNSQTNGWIASSDHENSAIRPKIIVTRRASKDVIEARSDMSRK